MPRTGLARDHKLLAKRLRCNEIMPLVCFGAAGVGQTALKCMQCGASITSKQLEICPTAVLLYFRQAHL